MQIWDHNDALERVLDNHDLLQQLVQLFLDSIPEQVADFQRAFSQHDFASVGISVERLSCSTCHDIHQLVRHGSSR